MRRTNSRSADHSSGPPTDAGARDRLGTDRLRLSASWPTRDALSSPSLISATCWRAYWTLRHSGSGRWLISTPITTGPSTLAPPFLRNDPSFETGQLSDDVETIGDILSRDDGEVILWHDLEHVIGILQRLSNLYMP
jgi:hypothetical protein